MQITQQELNHLIDWCVWCGYTAGQHLEGDYIKEANSIKRDMSKSGESLPAYILGNQ